MHVVSFDTSFPSGHEIRTVLLVSFLIACAPKLWPVGLAWLAAVTVMLVLGGWHTPSDVLGGLLAPSRRPGSPIGSRSAGRATRHPGCSGPPPAPLTNTIDRDRAAVLRGSDSCARARSCDRLPEGRPSVRPARRHPKASGWRPSTTSFASTHTPTPWQALSPSKTASPYPAQSSPPATTAPHGSHKHPGALPHRDLP
jgi:hypothetical protein